MVCGDALNIDSVRPSLTTCLNTFNVSLNKHILNNPFLRKAKEAGLKRNHFNFFLSWLETSQALMRPSSELSSSWHRSSCPAGHKGMFGHQFILIPYQKLPYILQHIGIAKYPCSESCQHTSVNHSYECKESYASLPCVRRARPPWKNARSTRQWVWVLWTPWELLGRTPSVGGCHFNCIHFRLESCESSLRPKPRTNGPHLPSGWLITAELVWFFKYLFSYKICSRCSCKLIWHDEKEEWRTSLSNSIILLDHANNFSMNCRTYWKKHFTQCHFVAVLHMHLCAWCSMKRTKCYCSLLSPLYEVLVWEMIELNLLFYTTSYWRVLQIYTYIYNVPGLPGSHHSTAVDFTSSSEVLLW